MERWDDEKIERVKSLLALFGPILAFIEKTDPAECPCCGTDRHTSDATVRELGVREKIDARRDALENQLRLRAEDAERLAAAAPEEEAPTARDIWDDEPLAVVATAAPAAQTVKAAPSAADFWDDPADEAPAVSRLQVDAPLAGRPGAAAESPIGRLMAKAVTELVTASRPFGPIATTADSSPRRAIEIERIENEIAELELVAATEIDEDATLAPEVLTELELQLRDATRYELALDDYKVATSRVVAPDLPALEEIARTMKVFVARELTTRISSLCLDVSNVVFGPKSPRVLHVQLFDDRRAVSRIGTAPREQTGPAGFLPWQVHSGAEVWFDALAVAHMIGQTSAKPLRLFCVDDVWLDAAVAVPLLRGIAAAHQAGSITQALVNVVELPPGLDAHMGDLMGLGWRVVKLPARP